MPMHRAIAACNAEQQRRQDRCREFGCVACHMEGHPGVVPEIQHLTTCGRTISQDHTIALCPWHHRGEPFPIPSKKLAAKLMGPSLAVSARDFHARYGSDEELLTMQNDLIGFRALVQKARKRSKGRTAKSEKNLSRELPAWRKSA